MTKKAWKTVFIVSMISFLLLSAVITGMVLVPMFKPSPDIIGGTGWLTFQFLLSEALRSPIGYIHSAAFLAAIVSFIGWRICKK